MNTLNFGNGFREDPDIEIDHEWISRTVKLQTK